MIASSSPSMVGSSPNPRAGSVVSLDDWSAMTHVSVISAVSLGTVSVAPSSRTMAVESMTTVHQKSQKTVSPPRPSFCGSGAGAAKREQLKRKACRLGLPEKHFVKKYKAGKDERRNARKEWYARDETKDLPLPPLLHRKHPVVHERTSGRERVKQSLPWSDDFALGETAAGIEY